MKMSLTRESTILLKARPMMTAMARSKTLAFNANSLNSFHMLLLSWGGDKRSDIFRPAKRMVIRDQDAISRHLHVLPAFLADPTYRAGTASPSLTAILPSVRRQGIAAVGLVLLLAGQRR